MAFLHIALESHDLGTLQTWTMDWTQKTTPIITTKPKTLKPTPNSTQYGPNGAQYSPNSAQYGPNGAQYSPNSAQYGPNGAQYSPNSAQHGPNGAQYSPNSALYGPTGFCRLLDQIFLLVHVHSTFPVQLVYRNTLWACANRKLFGQATCKTL